MSAVKAYSGDQVFILFGAITITGRGLDTFLSIEPNAEDHTLQIGVDGEGARSRSNDRSARMTVTIMQSSAANDLLSAQRNLDINSATGIVAPFMVKDFSGTSLYTAETAWIVTAPTSEFARESGTREWLLETNELVQNIGGLASATP